MLRICRVPSATILAVLCVMLVTLTSGIQISKAEPEEQLLQQQHHHQNQVQALIKKQQEMEGEIQTL